MKGHGIIKNLFFFFILLINPILFAQNTIDNNNFDDDYLDFGMAEGITIFGERPKEFEPETTEAYILNQLNGTPTQRAQFIETDLLKEAGFRRTGNVRFRKTSASEKALSVVYGIGHAFGGIIPMKPFREVEYERLPNGVFYSFETVIDSSELQNISPDVLSAIKLEYMLQIHFCNGIVYSNNANYYTEENINRFETLILELPEYSEYLWQIKERFLNIELPKIKKAYERHTNPSEDNTRALENLNNSWGSF